MKRILSYIASALLLLGVSSCIDDKLYDDTVIGEGEAKISAEVLFKNFVPALSDDSRATPGTALDGLTNIYLFVYTENGQQLLYNPVFTTGATTNGITILESTSTPTDGHYEPSKPEGSTQRGDFGFNIPFGRYKIYAVANVRASEAAKLAADKVQTEADLKKVSFDWDETDIASNGQMFGVFTTTALSSSPAAVFNAPVVTINQSDVILRAWLRRLASKVTVAFDATALRDNVRIYIKSVRLKDIPKSCLVGMNNTPTSDEQLYEDGGWINYTADDRNTPLSSINWSDMTAGIPLERGTIAGSKNHGNDDSNSLFFYENDQGDMSQDPNKDWYNKTQPADKVGTSINKPLPDPDHASGQNDYKDRKPYGTYIEVEAYYKSDDAEKLGEGKIIYRFMLGKDVTFNYDAERNYHYKLTLKFNNWANDPDWHIVYDEPKPTIITPNIYYISYLYNQQMGFPVRIITADGTSAKDYTLKAEIIANNWGPTADDPENNDTDYGDVPDQWSGAITSRNGFAWNKPVFDGTFAFDGGLLMKNDYSAKEVEIGDGKKIMAGANFVGFLSLRHDGNTVIGNGRAYADPETPQYLMDVYEGKSDVIKTPRYWAEYDLAVAGRNNVSGNSADGQYNVTHHTDGSVTASVPMYTRAKELVPATDFTGNNPFDAFMRLAFVKFTLYKTDDPSKTPVEFQDIENPDPNNLVKQRIVPIFQVRRINNPKVIWRSSSNNDPFNVVLTHRTNESTNTFEPFDSRGPWRAYILKDPSGVVRLKGKDGTTVTGEMSMNVYDEPTGTNMITNTLNTEQIAFTYEPTGNEGCAIIRVDYHDNSCHHLIFVRKGYDYAVELGKAKWTCYNAYATTAAVVDGGGNPVAPPEGSTQPSPNQVNVEVTNNPFSIGTFYKRGNYNYGLLESNNTKPDLGWLEGGSANNSEPITPALDYIQLNSANNKVFGTTYWNSFGGWAWSNNTNTASNRWNRAGEEYGWADTWVPTNKTTLGNLAVPTYDDFYSLIDRTQPYAENIEFAYGVAYGDGATEVALNMDDAYGFTDYDNDGFADELGSNGQTKGMRVCLVYNKTNGDQFLFPLGSVGQGRRARAVSSLSGSPYNLSTGRIGSISYGGVRGVLYGTDNGLRPLTYNLYRGAGAVYWLRYPKARQPNNDPDDMCASWDINYNNVVFNHYDSGSLNFQFRKVENKNEAGEVTSVTWSRYYSNGNTIPGRNNTNSSDAIPIKFILKK